MAEKKREEREIQGRVNQLKLVEQSIKTQVAAAQKTIEDYQYVGPQDLHRAKELLGIVQDIHLWRPLLGPTPTLESFKQDQRLQFVYDQSLKVSIDMTRIGKTTDAIQLSIFAEEEGSMPFDLSLTDTPMTSTSTLSALKPKKRRPFTEVCFVYVIWGQNRSR